VRTHLEELGVCSWIACSRSTSYHPSECPLERLEVKASCKQTIRPDDGLQSAMKKASIGCNDPSHFDLSPAPVRAHGLWFGPIFHPQGND